MIVGFPSKEDGYTERLMSIHEGGPWLLKLRAVKVGDNYYKARVRDYKTGCIVKEGYHLHTGLKSCEEEVIKLGEECMREMMNKS